MLGKLIGLASIGGTLINVSVLERYLTGLAGVVVLTILSALFGSLLLACGFYGLYVSLVNYGLDSNMAMIAVMVLIFIVTVSMASLAWARLQQLRHLPAYIVRPELAVVSKVQNVVGAFVDGYLDNPQRLRR